jgi:hypothetical protein
MCSPGHRILATGEILVTDEDTYHEFVNWCGRRIWVVDSEVVQLWSQFMGEG